MLRVDYSIVFGEVHGHNTDGKKWKVLFHPANCDLGAFIYHYTDDKGEKMAQLWMFLADKQHVKNVMKNMSDHTLLGTSVDKVKLNAYYKEAMSIVKECAQSVYKVEVYYKEPEKSKKV